MIAANEKNMFYFMEEKSKKNYAEVSKWYEQCYIQSFNRLSFYLYIRIQKIFKFKTINLLEDIFS